MHQFSGDKVKKIPTLLVRDPENRSKVLMEVTPGCEWVFAGEGKATRKYDGTCVMFDGGMWWARREVKPGKGAPQDFRAEHFDEVTGKTQGWEPLMNSAFIKQFNDALSAMQRRWHEFPLGTYELIGPKVNGNPENLSRHFLVEHATAERRRFFDKPSLATLCEAIKQIDYEGIVWHHPDGQMAKLKKRDL